MALYGAFQFTNLKPNHAGPRRFADLGPVVLGDSHFLIKPRKSIFYKWTVALSPLAIIENITGHMGYFSAPWQGGGATPENPHFPRQSA